MVQNILYKYTYIPIHYVYIIFKWNKFLITYILATHFLSTVIKFVIYIFYFTPTAYPNTCIIYSIIYKYIFDIIIKLKIKNN